MIGQNYEQSVIGTQDFNSEVCSIVSIRLISPFRKRIELLLKPLVLI